MCTVSWLFNEQGYQLFFNRDELKSRQRAELPAIKESQQTRIISPTDPDAGGTWISVNEHGLSLCLLNNYAAQASPEQQRWISRGLLVLNLSHATDSQNLLAEFNRIDLENYRAFNLLALSPNDHVCQLCWNGFELEVISNPVMPITSSSYATDKVISHRLQHFDNELSSNTLQPKQLQQYHASHSPEAGAFSVCMHRDNGQTVSFSHIEVNADQIRFNYYDGSPCCTTNTHSTQLDLLSTARHHVA